ncbi:MAG: caspase family protein [Pirellulaceae bacterium]
MSGSIGLRTRFYWLGLFAGLLLLQIGGVAAQQQEQSTDKKAELVLEWPPVMRSGDQDLQPGRTPFQQSMQEIYRMDFQGTEVSSGIQIVSVTLGGPATGLKRVSDGALITLEAGDIITEVNGQATRTFPDYFKAMEVCKETGGRVELKVQDVRTGNVVDFVGQATLQCLATDQPLDPAYAYRLRFRAEPASPRGLKLTWVDELGPMSRLTFPDNRSLQASAEPGDIVVSIDGVNVNSEQDYRAAMERVATKCGQTNLEMINVRNGVLEPWIVKAALTKREDLVPQPFPPIMPVQPDPVRPQPQPEDIAGAERKIHIVLCGLTNDPSIGKMVGISIERLQRVISERIGENFIGTYKVITGADCNAQNILEQVRQLSMKPQDAVFCFYVGHGAHSTFFPMNDVSGGHFFQIPNRDLSRKQLFDALAAHGVRLTVLLSDTCNVESDQPPRFGETRPELSVQRIKGLTGFEKLLLEAKGNVNISASSPGEFSWFSIPVGGWFTEQFANAMLADPADWREAYDDMRERTGEFYRIRRSELLGDPTSVSASIRDSLQGQDDLRPAAFQLNVTDDPYTSFDHNLEREMQRTHYSFAGGRRR